MRRPDSSEVRAAAPRLIRAAQAVLDGWEQDEEGLDPELGAGGACQDVASAMAGALSEIDVEEVVEVYTELDGGHVFLVSNLADGVFRVDVPPGCYETGAGYVWRKRDGVRLLPENVNSPPPEAPYFSAGRVHAFFSNYIEGTRFLVGEAREIVFEGKIPQSRPQDGHDVLATYANLMEPPRPRLSEMSPDQFVLSLQVDHGDLMRERPEVGPGRFKTAANHAGNTVFVAPEKVHGTLHEGFEHVRAVSDPFARAVLAHFLISDVHPFSDGNGRMSRLAMSRELISHGLSHIVIPTVFRQDYLSAMRAMTRQNNPDILIRSLSRCQQVSAACAAETLDEAIGRWASTHAFLEEDRHASLTDPQDPSEVVWRDGVPAPRRYWEHVDFDRDAGTGPGVS